MTAEEVMGLIEGQEFAAEANVASGSRAFYGGLRGHPLLTSLLEQMRQPCVPERILNRILELSSRQVHPSIENPFDTALTAYLTALELQNSELTGRAAEAISKAPNCWWAAEMSSRILARVYEGQMPLPLSLPGMNANVLGAGTSLSPRPTYRPQRAKERSVNGHRRRRLNNRAVA